MNGPLVLVILDGWGIAPESPGNAVKLAKTPNLDAFWAGFPHTQLLASGESVGLPKNEPGNSETGHLNLGAGRIVYQDLPRINLSIADGSFFKNQAFLKAFSHVRREKSNLHLLGLVGSGGVHSSLEHLYAFLRLSADQKIKDVYLHLFTDGRDSPPASALIYINQIEEELKVLGLGKIASISGRYYALDRDNRWERIQKVYDALTLGIGERAQSSQDAIKNSYQKRIFDEFINPTIIVNKENQPIKLIKDNDAVIFLNFRIDRPRELTKAFVLEDFEKYFPKRASFDPYAERYGHKQFEEIGEIKTFKRKKILKNLFFVIMTKYEDNLPVEVAFPQIKVELTLARVLSTDGKRQFHIAETEKYPHISNFFDGLATKPFSQEEWAEVSSPKVATYDLKPEMSAEEVTNQFLKRFQTGLYSFALINFANPDMVAHTGNLNATIKACEITDYFLGKIVKKVLAHNGTAIVTADHGNAERLINLETGEIDTEHSANPVPFILINKSLTGKGETLPQGFLADVAPTILNIFKITIPNLMTGNVLFP